MYEELNDEARDYFLIMLPKLIKNKEKLERCTKEIEFLYKKGFLFLVESLHKYHKKEKDVKFCFRGMSNNFLLLYVLGLSKVDPIKYRLPYELFTEKSLCIDFVNGCSFDFVDYIHQHGYNYRLIKGSFEFTDVEAINELEDHYYLVIPRYVVPRNMTFRFNEFDELETIEDYHLFKDEYITIRLDDKGLLQEKEVSLKNALYTNFEKNLEKLLKPKTMNDYVKIISLGHSTHLWKENQEKLFVDDFSQLIANREDVLEYLLHHKIPFDTAVEIVKQLSKDKKDTKLWEHYVKIMMEYQCEKRFIDILSKTLFLSGRGQAVSECLYALDEKNYL